MLEMVTPQLYRQLHMFNRCRVLLCGFDSKHAIVDGSDFRWEPIFTHWVVAKPSDLNGANTCSHHPLLGLRRLDEPVPIMSSDGD